MPDLETGQVAVGPFPGNSSAPTGVCTYTVSAMDESVIQSLRPWFPELDFGRVHLVHSGPVAWFVRNVLRQGAMTIAPFIFFGKHRYDPASPRSMALLAHELQHIEQYRAMGHLPFLFTYMRDRIRAGEYRRDLPLEAEPYALQEEVRTILETRHV